MESSVDLSAEQTLEEWRAMMFEELGFNEVQAAALAVGHNDDGSPIGLHQVSNMIENGCPLELVLKIVL